MLLRQYPWLGYWGQRVWRLRQPRFTAGAVGVVLNDAGNILLLEHIFHPIHPWGLPGGWVDRNEAPDEAVVRELREETGLQVKVEIPVLVELGSLPGHLDIAYLCRLEGGEIRLSNEILSHSWCAPDELPVLSSFHRRTIDRAVGFWRA